MTIDQFELGREQERDSEMGRFYSLRLGVLDVTLRAEVSLEQFLRRTSRDICLPARLSYGGKLDQRLPLGRDHSSDLQSISAGLTHHLKSHRGDSH